MKIGLIFIFILTSAASSSALEKLLFEPLTANIFEPRIGSSYQFSNDRLRLDIGASFDLADLKIFEDIETRFGTDFFTYTRLRSEGSFKFPVETSDYFFGVNFSALKKFESTTLSGRLRISHISSHLVDGYANGKTFIQAPFVYSREFTDLVIALRYKMFRFYAGWQLLFSKIPNDFSISNYQFGFDVKYPVISFISITGGYNMRTKGIHDIYTSVHSTQIGIYFALSEKTGISIDHNYFEGKSIHGMFYNDKDIYSSLGIRIIYFY